MTAHNAYTTATHVAAIDGEVTLNGPDGVGLSMTPDAAEETARRLLAASVEARGQKPAGDNDDQH